MTTGADSVTYVGKTADGKDCDLDEAAVAELEASGKTVNSPLAKTGAAITGLALAALVLTCLGIALRKRAA